MNKAMGRKKKIEEPPYIISLLKPFVFVTHISETPPNTVKDDKVMTIITKNIVEYCKVEYSNDVHYYVYICNPTSYRKLVKEVEIADISYNYLKEFDDKYFGKHMCEINIERLRGGVYEI